MFLQLLLSLLALSLASMSQSAEMPNRFPLASNQFGLDLYKIISRENAALSLPENIFYSPFSLATALTMVQQGSKEKSERELSQGLQLTFAKLNGEEKKAFLALKVKETTHSLFEFQKTNVSTKLDCANALMVLKPEYKLQETYKKALKDNFHAELFQLELEKSPEEVKTFINQWVSNKTHGKISEILSKPPERDAALALLNAVYFKGSWAQPFDPDDTTKRSFFPLKGAEQKDVDFMTVYEREMNVSKFPGTDAALIELPFEGEELSFFGLLPRKNDSLETLRLALSYSSIDHAINELSPRKINFQFPKLSLSTDYNLIEPLKKLGIVDIFGEEANLSGTVEGRNLKVVQVIHRATIEVNEKGSEAAAATYIEDMDVSFPLFGPEVENYIFDHPFLFFIRHKPTNLILFLGEVDKI